MEDILSTTPEMYAEVPTAALDKWKQLGPLSVQEVIDKSGINPQDLDLEEQCVKKQSYGSVYYLGMHKKGTMYRNGICRSIFKGGLISEGMYINDKLNGFGRSYYPNGAYYIGMWKDHKRHGYGKFVYTNGKIDDGIWENNLLKV